MYRCLGAIGFILRFSTIINLSQIPPHWLNDICSSTIGNKRWTFVKFGGRREELVCGSLFVLCPSIYHVGDCCFVVLRKTSASSRNSLYWGRKIHSWKSWPTFFSVAEISKLLCRCFDRRGADILRSYPQSGSGSSITKIVLPKTGKGMVNWKRIVQKESLPSFKSFLYTAKRTVCNSLRRRMACHYDEWLVTMSISDKKDVEKLRENRFQQNVYIESVNLVDKILLLWRITGPVTFCFYNSQERKYQNFENKRDL